MTTAPAHDLGGTPCQVHLASPWDALRISLLYKHAYSSGDGRTPEDNYPFPQILDPRWVESAIETGMVSWLVAESEGRVVGAAALLHGLGSVVDRIGECFGLVVDREARGRGVGVELLSALGELTRREVEVGIGQMRTSDPSVARVVRRCGLHPLGFEPFVHHMLAGKESMVAVALLSERALARRSRRGSTTAVVHRLAGRVLEPLGLPPLEVACQRAVETPPEVQNIELKEVDDEVGADLMRRLGHRNRCAPEFVDLRRMDELGRHSSRRKQRYFCGIAAGRATVCIHVAHNQHDHHMRIEAVASESDGTLRAVLRALLAWVSREADGRAGVMVAEVATMNIHQQLTLESLGFVPTIYCPALVAWGTERLDVIQYTRLSGCSISEVDARVHDSDWPEMEEIVRTVTGQWQLTDASIRHSTAIGSLPGVVRLGTVA